MKSPIFSGLETTCKCSICNHERLFFSPVLDRLVLSFVSVPEVDNLKSPHTITSGLLFRGRTNHA